MLHRSHSFGTLLAPVLAVAALLVAAPAAFATPTIKITVGPDPVESITTQLGLTGNADSSDSYVALKVRPSGGVPCGANPDADSGDTVVSDYIGSGPISESDNYTFRNAGSYLLCAWLRDNANGDQIVAQISTTITVRQPKLSLSIAAPPAVAPDQTFQVTTTAQAEAERTVFVKVLPDTGRGCPANTAAARNDEVDSVESYWNVTGGPLSDTQNVTIGNAGAYLLCGYFQYDTNDAPPEATAVANLQVAKRLPPPKTGPSAACVSARSQVKKWSRLVKKTKNQMRFAHGSNKAKLRKKLAAEKRTLKRAQDRQTIHC